MNLAKSYEYFQPEKITDKLHIIGCGAIGSTVAFFLAKLGLQNIILYDEDIVESKNVANQMYRNQDVGRSKTEALKDMLAEINPELANTVQIKGFYTDEQLDGYVFMAADSIKVRKVIAESNKFNTKVKAMFDFRMRLEDAQHYAADWSDIRMKDDFIASMEFTDEEAEDATPRSACHETLSFMPTITGITGWGIDNFVRFCKNKEMKKMILYNAPLCAIDGF